ncbi:MAG: hypothetical protein IH596_12075 [Bacteroidales bacterium]|nr:hypothetical protein [Bacteroidales bacterium]
MRLHLSLNQSDNEKKNVPEHMGIYPDVGKPLCPILASDRIHMECQPPAPGKYNLTLINASGQVMFQKEIRSTGMIHSQKVITTNH